MAFPAPKDIETLAAPILSRFGLVADSVAAKPAGAKSSVVIAVEPLDPEGTTEAGLVQLEKVAGELSIVFDAAEEKGTINFGPGYTLEVTTPGIDRPLTCARHWRAARRHLVHVTGPADDFTARVGAVAPDGRSVILVGLVEAGQKKPHPDVEPTLTVYDLPGNPATLIPAGTTARVDVEFSAPRDRELHLADLPYDDALMRAERRNSK